ncbi:MAG TPA: transcriptional repressor [Candidatus Saccharibacteria bacterium]|nr:transcriptional repressor [Candidatus Saccharibacteria bacterium]
MTTYVDRTTRYVAAVRNALQEMGHASNAEILNKVKAQYPAVSATTIHRVTARLLERGEIRLAPTKRDNAMRFDDNAAPHDHFMCTVCEQLKDTMFDRSIRQQIETLVSNGCSISGDLTVTGVCKNCKRRQQI